MRIVAVVLGVLVLAGTILLVVAGFSAGPGHSNAMGPLAFLLCIVAVAVMIVLGVTFGGRNNPRRAARDWAGFNWAGFNWAGFNWAGFNWLDSGISTRRL